MYKHNLKQLELPDFVLPFQGELSLDNKWVKMAALVPWEELEERYRKNFSNSNVGHPALCVRMALAALIIKEELRASDRACVGQITKNPYLQYFCGLKNFIKEPPFDASMFVHFRKRFPADVLSEVNNAIAAKIRDRQIPPDDLQSSKGGGKAKDAKKTSPSHKGKLMVDATCTPADNTFPTDIKLLNKTREKSEQIIDILHKARGKGHKKPRTYRQRAGRQFLSVAKLRRNLKSIGQFAEHTGLRCLPPRSSKDVFGYLRSVSPAVVDV